MRRPLSLLIPAGCALLLGSCVLSTNLTRATCELGRTHEAYRVPAEENGTVYKLDGHYYVKARVGPHKKSYDLAESMEDLLSPAAFIYYPDSTPDFRTVFCRVNISGSEQSLKKRGVLETLDILDAVEAGQFDLKRAKAVGKVALPSWKNRYGNEYVQENGSSDRNPFAVLAFPLLPVTAVLDFTTYILAAPLYFSPHDEQAYDTGDRDEDKDNSSSFLFDTTIEQESKKRHHHNSPLPCPPRSEEHKTSHDHHRPPDAPLSGAPHQRPDHSHENRPAHNHSSHPQDIPSSGRPAQGDHPPHQNLPHHNHRPEPAPNTPASA